MKKEIIEQLLKEKPSIYNNKLARELERESANAKIMSELRDDFIYKSNSGKKTSRKLDYFEQLIFLRIFKKFRKKYKNENQFSVAKMLKSYFNDANLINKFQYYELGEDEGASVYAEAFLRGIGLTPLMLANNSHYNLRRPEYMLNELNEIADYVTSATPEAIVQMNKRLKKEHKK